MKSATRLAIDAFIGSLRHGDPIAALEAEHALISAAYDLGRRLSASGRSA